MRLWVPLGGLGPLGSREGGRTVFHGGHSHPTTFSRVSKTVPVLQMRVELFVSRRGAPVQ